MAQDFSSFTGGTPPEVAELLSLRGAGLADLGVQLRETALMGIESVTGQRALLRGVSIGVTDPAAIEAEFRPQDHMGFEVRLTLAPGVSLPAAMLVGIADLGTLLTLELDPSGISGDQVEAVASALREFLDLIAVALGGDALSGVELSLASHRVGAVQETAELLAAAADGLSLVRVDLDFESAGIPAHVVVVAPPMLIDTLIGDQPAAQPLPSPSLAGVGLGIGSGGGPGGDAFTAEVPPSNVSQMRAPGGTPRVDVDVHPVRFPPLPEQRVTPPAPPQAFDLIMDVSMRVTVELGRSSMTVEEVLSLGPGSVVELDKLAGEPVDVLVNDQLIARGEVVVVDENFGVRVTEIVSPRRRVQAMGA